MGNNASNRFRLDIHSMIIIKGRAMTVEARDTHSVLARDVLTARVEIITETKLRALWDAGKLVILLDPKAKENAIRECAIAHLNAVRPGEQPPSENAAGLADGVTRFPHSEVSSLSAMRRWLLAFIEKEQQTLRAQPLQFANRKPCDQIQEGQFSCGGLPDKIVLDGEPGFCNRPFRDPCTALGIGVKMVPPGKPRFKATIERLMRGIKRGA